MWVPVLFSYVKPSAELESITTFLFLAIISSFTTYATFRFIQYRLFKPLPGRYWIQKGKHYADGLFWSRVRNVKFLFFKKEIELWYRIDPRAIQDDYYQKNKIFGITSILYRRNSVRETFASRPKTKSFDVYNYRYADQMNLQTITDLNRKAGVWHHSKLKAPKTIWFGLYHFPYHGGKIESKSKYFIDISFREPS